MVQDYSFIYSFIHLFILSLIHAGFVAIKTVTPIDYGR